MYHFFSNFFSSLRQNLCHAMIAPSLKLSASESTTMERDNRLESVSIQELGPVDSLLRQHHFLKPMLEVPRLRLGFGLN